MRLYSTNDWIMKAIPLYDWKLQTSATRMDDGELCWHRKETLDFRSELQCHLSCPLPIKLFGTLQQKGAIIP